MSDKLKQISWPYGLGDVESIEGEEVTDGHRIQAMSATDCECLKHMDRAVSELSPDLRRYGATLMKIATQFQNARGTIREEMTRIARRNLECVVMGNLQGRRVLNAGLATAEKEARDNPPMSGPVKTPETSTEMPETSTEMPETSTEMPESEVDPKLGFLET